MLPLCSHERVPKLEFLEITTHSDYAYVMN